LKFDGEDTQVIIGDETTIRECVTVNRGTKALGYTKIGAHCLIMATSHIAHDCVIGDHVIIVNGCGIAGHVEIGDYTVMGGLSAVHQFGKIGKHVMISGGTLVRKDIPPYVKVAREPMSYAGINSVGLRRRGFTNEKIFEIQKIYRAIFQMKMNVSQAISHIEKEMLPTAERDEILQFIQNSPRGIVKGYGTGKDRE
jgi:UDP-N-acetylglucosamine acyltransferase